MNDEKMEQLCTQYLWKILLEYGIDRSFVIGTLNSLKTPLQKVTLLRFLEMCSEYNIIPTKPELAQAVDNLLQLTTDKNEK